VRAGVSTLNKLRRMYSEAFGRDWPEDDAYLGELWGEARAAVKKGQSKVPPPEVWECCTTLMRECHEFTPAGAP
jgi:hypothetical protein